MEDNCLSLCCGDLWFVPTALMAVLLSDCFVEVRGVLGNFTVSSWGRRRYCFPILYSNSYCLLLFLSHFSILTYLLECSLSHTFFHFLFASSLPPSLSYTCRQSTRFHLSKKRGTSKSLGKTECVLGKDMSIFTEHWTLHFERPLDSWGVKGVLIGNRSSSRHCG